jgi:hypothetical protein
MSVNLIRQYANSQSIMYLISIWLRLRLWFSHSYTSNPLEADDSEEEPSVGGCEATRYGCCSDGVNTATGSILLGCPASVSGSGPSSDPLNSGSSEPPLIGGCAGTRYGCCRDGVTAASGNNFLGCPSTSPSGSGSGSSSGRPPLIGGCEATRYGCCSDGTTAATGRILLGCPSTSASGSVSGSGSGGPPLIGGCAGGGCALAMAVVLTEKLPLPETIS